MKDFGLFAERDAGAFKSNVLEQGGVARCVNASSPYWGAALIGEWDLALGLRGTLVVGEAKANEKPALVLGLCNSTSVRPCLDEC